MTIYFAGSSGPAFAGTCDNLVNTVTNSYSNPSFSTQGALELGTATMPRPLGSLSEVWCKFVMGQINASAAESQARTIMEMRNSSAVGVLRVQMLATAVRELQYWNGSAWVNLYSLPLADGGTDIGRQWDVHCKIDGTVGRFALYVDKILRFEFNGDTDHFTGSAVDEIRFDNWGRFNSRAISEVVVADADTRKMRVRTSAPTGNGQTGWTGGFGNVDEVPTTYTSMDADATVSSSAGQVVTFTKASAVLSVIADNRSILAVGVAARARDNSGTEDFELVLRQGGVNYQQAHTRTITNAYTNGFYAIWNTDPSTSAAWDLAGVNSVEMGAIATVGGGVSISGMHMVVVFEEDDAIAPWEDTYPVSEDGFEVVNFTTTGAAGLRKLVSPACAALGLQPTGVIFLCNGSTDAVNSAALLGLTAWSNHHIAQSGFNAGAMSTYASAQDAVNSGFPSAYLAVRSIFDYTTGGTGNIGPFSSLDGSCVGWCNGGVIVDFIADTTASRTITAIFFWGGTKFALDLHNLGTGTSAIPITGVGFQPDAVIGVSAIAAGFSAVNGGSWSFGIAVDDGGVVQRALLRNSTYLLTAGPAPGQMIDNTAFLGLLSTAGTVTWDLTFNSFDADGFTVTPSASAGSVLMCWIAIKMVSKQLKLRDISTATATGNQANTGVGFYPGVGLGLLTSLQAINTIVYDTEEGSSVSLFAAGQDLTQSVEAMSEQSTSDPSVCKRWHDPDAVVRIGTDNGNVANVIGALTSWDSDGFTINYSVVSGTAKIGFVLLIEGTPPDSNSLDSNSNSNDVAAGGVQAGYIFVVM